MITLGHHQLLMRAQSAPPGGDPYWDDVIALLHFDSNPPLIDEAGYTWSLNYGSLGLPSRFGAAALVPALTGEGTSSHLAPTNGRYDFPGDFTIESWARQTSTSGVQAIVTRQTPSMANGIAIQLRTNVGKLEGVLRQTTTPFVITSPILLPTDTYVHLVLQRRGDAVTLFQDGSPVASGTFSDALEGGSRPWGVGYLAGGLGGQFFSGQIDDVRITRDRARYSELGFTPPTEPFPNFGT